MAWEFFSTAIEGIKLLSHDIDYPVLNPAVMSLRLPTTVYNLYNDSLRPTYGEKSSKKSSLLP